MLQDGVKITSSDNVFESRFDYNPLCYYIAKNDEQRQSAFYGELDIRTLEGDAQVLVYLSLWGF